VRILHVDSARTWRGGQNQVLLTAHGQARRGHTVSLACQAGGVLEARAHEAGLEVHPLRFQGDLSPLAALQLLRLAAGRRPDVLHLHDPHALVPGLLAARATLTARTVATRRVDFPLRGGLSRFKYRSCSRLIGVSRGVLDVLRAGGVLEQRLRLVYEGVPDRRPQPGGQAVLEELGIPAGAPLVGNIAALTDHKDHRTLLEAAARLLGEKPEARFLIVGEGELESALRAQARALGIAERVVFAGFRCDLDRLIPCFDVFCLSSHMEGLGTSLLDAMAFGRPVVATAAGGIPEAVEDGVSGRLVPVRDPHALAQALVGLLGDESLRREMGRAGRRIYEERFTAERMVDATLAAYA
jgi:glycosyltransferase involved in cell wall biosynthesis